MNASIDLAPNFESDVGETKKFPRVQQLVGLSWKHSLCMPSLHSGKKGLGSTCPFSMLVEQEREREEGPRVGSRRGISQ